MCPSFEVLRQENPLVLRCTNQINGGLNDRRWYRSLFLGGARQHFKTLHGIVPGLFIRSSGTISPTARHFSPAALSLPRHCDGKEEHRIILTVYFPEEHVNGSSEEFCSLVPARVQQRRRTLLQGREGKLRRDWHGCEPIREIRWSSQGVVAHKAM